jgi:glutamate-ammonia-ligase adenylyltransferase
VVLYDFDDDRTESDGARPLSATTYYARLTQRLISALTVPTSRGTLYAVDMRLRPSGNKGPAATQYRGFLNYQREEAETWEQLALARARPVAGDPAFRAEVEASIVAVLRQPRDAKNVLKDTLAMRRLIATEKGEADPWELKLAAGGLLDIEFIAQALVLCHADRHPAIAVTGTAAILEAARGQGLLDPETGVRLSEAFAELRDLFQWIRLTVSGRFDPKDAGEPLKRRLAASVGLPDFRVLHGHIEQTRRDVRTIFERQMRKLS